MYKKKFRQRLLGMILAVLMIVGIVPTGGLEEVQAAGDAAANSTFYLDATKLLTSDNGTSHRWDFPGAGKDESTEICEIKAYVWYNGNGNASVSSETLTMSAVADRAHWYQVTVPKASWKIRFERQEGNKDAVEFRFDSRSSDSVNVIQINGWTSAAWNGIYGGDHSSETTFLVAAELVDYLNDNRVPGYDDTTHMWDNQGTQTGPTNKPYSKLNSWISNLPGYATGDIWKSDDPNATTKTIYVNSWGTTGTPYIHYWGGEGVNSTTVEMTTANVTDGTSYYLWKANIPNNAENCMFATDNTLTTNKSADFAIISNMINWKAGTYGSYDEATGKVSSVSSQEGPIPLYFGDLYHKNQLVGGGDVNNFYRGANVSFSGETGAVAQGIVGDHLVNGHLVTSYSDEVLVPFFEEGAYTDQDAYMKFYKDLQFPFTATTTNGVTKYSFNSEKNTVYYDYTNHTLIRDDTLHIYDAKNKIGYFPFNNNNSSQSVSNALNYGNGTKFTIPFTINESGKDANGDPITFNFTGDDDVWVYIDGALVLDMGGAHEKASGNINFFTNKATVTTGTANAATDLGVYGGNSLYVSNNKQEVSFDDIEVILADGSTKSLTEHMATQGEVHTLVMYYMERGMWDSNLSIDFSFSPLPSGLSLSKTVEVDDVNAGLQEAAKTLDTFDFEMTDDSTNTNEYKYVKDYHGSGLEDATTVTSVVSGLASNIFARDFEYADGDGLELGTEFTITENLADDSKYSTRWFVTDLQDSSNVVARGSDKEAKFTLGEADPDDPFKTVSYNVNFVNAMKVGSVAVIKSWNDDSAAVTDKEFEFKIEIDLKGDGTYSPYALAYTSSEPTRSGSTSDAGKFNIKVGETVTFEGIPVGAAYRITETAPTADDEWTIDSVAGTGAAQDSENPYVATGKIESEGTTSTVTYTNKDASISLSPDQIVIDYGKAVNVDVLANDNEMLTNSGYTAKVVGFKTYEADATDTTDYKTVLSAEETGGYGNYSIEEDKVKFQLTKFLDAVEKVNCVVELTSTTDSNVKKYYLNELDIIPATSMYYEDNFSDAIIYTGASAEGGNYNSVWTTVTGSGYDNLQADGTVGANAPYGYDASYNDDKSYSNGSARSIYSVSGSGGYNITYATFTFTGTGFDLISKTSTDAGIIKAEIYQGDKAEGTIYKSAQVANVGASELYQIPVLSCEGMPYGTYTVKVQVYEEYTNDSFPILNRGGQFVFDALRIYDPIDVSAETLTGDAAIAQNAYIQDGEAYEQHIRLRDYILSKEKFDATLEEEDGDGVVYIDATVSNPTQANDDGVVADYKMAGPNNETYLKSGNGIVFILNAKEVPKSIQIGAKSVVGESVNLCVDIMNPADNDVSVYIDEAFSQAAAQNYSTFTDSDDNTVTDLTPYFIKNGDYYQAYISIYNWDDGILSITDIKATFNSATDMPVTVDQGAVSAAASKIRARMGYIPSEDVTEEEDTEENKSELYSAEFTTAKVVATKQATLNVISTADIEEMVIINAQGKKLSVASSSEMTADGNKMWTLKFKTGQLGTCVFNVHGVTADGTETESLEVSIEATKR